MQKHLVAALAALAFATPFGASAQEIPSYAESQQSPGDENVHGRITSFDGAYELQVRDERGYVDTVQLHQGTIINPRGITLAPGMIVSVLGYNAGSYLSANEIDTPYSFYGGEPYYAGHPWRYYGPSVSLGFYFGNAGWWHGGHFGDDYRYDRGARVYSGNVRVTNVYREQGGQFRGRDYVAPQERGGYDGGMRNERRVQNGGVASERGGHDGGGQNDRNGGGGAGRSDRGGHDGGGRSDRGGHDGGGRNDRGSRDGGRPNDRGGHDGGGQSER